MYLLLWQFIVSFDDRSTLYAILNLDTGELLLLQTSFSSLLFENTICVYYF